MNDPMKLCFEMERLTISLKNILPVRPLRNPKTHTTRYSTILASIKTAGLVEPLMVYPQKGFKEKYVLMDGHLRYYALQELGEMEATCLISTEDESFTFNAQISRLSPVQEHSMIMRAVKCGVSPERIAAALNRKVSAILNSMSLLDGIAPEAINILKTTKISVGAIKVLKRVKPFRQVEMAEVMHATGNFTAIYARALLLGTKDDMLVQKKKQPAFLSLEDASKIETELESLEKDFKALEESYAETVISLTVAQRYIKKLLSNSKLSRFLTERYQEILAEFQAIAALEAI